MQTLRGGEIMGLNAHLAPTHSWLQGTLVIYCMTIHLVMYHRTGNFRGWIFFCSFAIWCMTRLLCELKLCGFGEYIVKLIFENLIFTDGPQARKLRKSHDCENFQSFSKSSAKHMTCTCSISSLHSICTRDGVYSLRKTRKAITKSSVTLVSRDHHD